MKKNRKVFIVGSAVNYSNMFEHYGWEVTQSFEEASLIQFTGGEDINPALYGQKALSTTTYNPIRDRREVAIFEAAYIGGKAIVGICRGAQLINVMMGGSLKQDIHGHTSPHKMRPIGHMGEEVLKNLGIKSYEIKVSSTHHQSMNINSHANVLFMSCGEGLHSVYECITYEYGRLVCYQPHPEFNRRSACAKIYMYLVGKAVDQCVEL